AYAVLEVGEVPETTLFRTGFEGTLEPPWTVSSNGNGEGESATWTVADPGGRQLLDPPFAIVDSEHLGPGFTLDEALISPAVDTSAHSSSTLRFRHDFRWYGPGLAERGDVEVRSAATGGTWILLRRFEGGDASGTVELDLGPYSATDVEVRFRYWNAEWEWWWALDEVRIWGDDGRRCFTAIFLDGFESGHPGAWSATSP
ncbi:MAG: hypothetical protein MI919_22375, partial [Holophagales bacterium]|nr:hypothetical protein [Holophagales bacterium]